MFDFGSSCRHLPTSYTPAALSSLTTTAISVAASTPLPGSDDSDQFESPAESPSQLEEHLMQNITKPPKLELDEHDEVIPVQDTPRESHESCSTEVQLDDSNFKNEDSHRSVEQSFEDKDSCSVPSKPTLSFPPSGLQEKLPRDSVSSIIHSPLKVQSPHEPTAQPAPPVHVVSSTEPARVFSPIPLLSELIESKKVKLMKSIGETKKRHTAAIKDQSYYFSPTMVKHTINDEMPMVTSTLQGTQYSFSPPTDMYDPKAAKSPTVEADGVAPFVFSPPLTRSAARRLKEKGDNGTSSFVGDPTSVAKKERERYAMFT